MASAGWRNWTPLPSTSIAPPDGRRDPASDAEQLVLALSLQSHDAEDLARDGGRTKRRGAWSRPAGFGPAGEGDPVSRADASWLRLRQSCALSMRAPSISSTIFSSAPGAISTTPTVSPSLSTVARWQSAEISSSRCEMKMMDRPVWLCRRTTSMTRSARFAGNAAVISSSRSTSGSIASARARSSTRRIASGMRRAVSRRSRSATPSSRTQLMKDETGVCVSLRLDSMSRSGTSAGSWYTETNPARRASAGECTARASPRIRI